MKKNKVLVFSPHALENGRGGEISTMELATGLQQFYNISLFDTNICSRRNLLSRETILRKVKGVKEISKIKFAFFKTSKLNFSFPYPWEIRRLYRKVKENDIIYFSYHDFKQALIFMMFSLLHRQGKFIIGYRKPLHSDKLLSLYNLKYRLSILFLSLFKKRIYHHTLSHHAKIYLENFYDPSKVFHIIHGIELSKFVYNKIKKKKNNKLKFVYIGYLDDAHKGIAVLLKAIELFLKKNIDTKVFFEFCGMGLLESEVKNLERKFPEYIKFYGYIDNSKIAEYYGKNDVYLFSSRREPFPRTIMEALASGLIVISSKTIGSIELLKRKKFAFFIKELSPIGIFEKLYQVYIRWLKNPNEIRELQEEAKEFVFKYYSFERELSEFKALINVIFHK